MHKQIKKKAKARELDQNISKSKCLLTNHVYDNETKLGKCQNRIIVVNQYWDALD